MLFKEFSKDFSNGMMGAGIASSTIGGFFSAQTNKANLNAQAVLDGINARMAESTAQSILYAGQREESNSKLKTAQLKGSQRAAMAANGVDLGGDSAVNVLTSTDVMGEADANTIHANAVRSAWGYRTQATNMQNDALMKRAQASSISPGTSAFNSLLTSASSVSDKWMKLDAATKNTGG